MSGNTKKILISIFAIILFTLAIVAVSYAYYTAKITEIGNGNKVSGSTAKLSTTFEDGEIINLTNIVPGDHFDKTFTLENNGAEIRYKIVVNELVNEFESYEDITYVLKEDDLVIKEGTFPKEAANNELSETRTLKSGERKTYTIIVTYQNTEEDQTKDMGKTISGKLFIKEL